MRYYFLLAFLSGFTQINAQDTFKLAPPILGFESVFFKKNIQIGAAFAMKGAQIRYTLNGQDPTEKDRLYKLPLRLKAKHTLVKIRAFHKDFLPSDVDEAEFFRTGFPVKNISMTAPAAQYPGLGQENLIDAFGGKTALSSPSWMGFLNDTVEIHLELKQAETIRQVMLNVLENQAAWIFLPQKLEAYVQDPVSGEKLIASLSIPAETEQSKTGCKAITLPLDEPCKTRSILVKVYPLASIPKSHPGKGNPAWLFIDEINLY